MPAPQIPPPLRHAPAPFFCVPLSARAGRERFTRERLAPFNIGSVIADRLIDWLQISTSFGCGVFTIAWPLTTIL